MKNYRQLIDFMYSGTCGRFTNKTVEKEFLAWTLYETIRRAICDLQHGSKKLQEDANKYFSSSLFDTHCRCLAVRKESMLNIVNNPDKYLQSVIEFNVINKRAELSCESN